MAGRGVRFSVEPLAAVLGLELHRPGRPVTRAWMYPGETGGLGALAVMVGVSHRTTRRWMQLGMTEWQADRAACAVGLHPSLVWGELWWSTAALEDDEWPVGA